MDNLKDDIYYTKRILKNVEVLSRYLRNKTQDDLLNDGFLCDAIENRFTKLSEDSSKLSKNFKNAHSTIPWTAIYSIRNRICHDYDVVDSPTLYKTVKVSFPVFRIELLRCVPHHRMTLLHRAFLNVCEGRKTVEIRLNDSKGKAINLGDLIVFVDEENEEEAIVEICGINPFLSFDELYTSYSKQELGYCDDENVGFDGLFAHYGKDDVKKRGVLAIEFKLY